jgi:predicted GIY-YIG superfamily endonuclease
MMAFWVYILRCSDGSYYTGHTDNLEERIGKHKTGTILSCYTFKRRPIELVFSQEFSTREQALSSEQQIKGWSRKKKEAMMRNDWAEVSRLAHSATSVRLDLPATVHPEPYVTVRPELVEGRFTVRSELLGKAQENLEGRRTSLPDDRRAPSVHPSTGSGRTEGDEA